MIRRGALLLPLLLAACILGAASAQQPEPAARAVFGNFEVVSYNIRYGERIAQALIDLRGDGRLAGADVYLLQEMDLAGAETLAESLSCRCVYARAFVHPHTGRPFGTAVLSRWPVTGQRIVRLPHPDSGTDNRRIALAVDLEVESRLVRVISVHLATAVNSLQDRLEQAGTVLDSLAVVGCPVIVGGDFNTLVAYEASLVRRLFRRAGFTQVHLDVSSTLRTGLRAWLLRLGGEEPILDHLFARGLEPTSGGLASGARASDHYPIWATFGWPGGRNPDRAAHPEGAVP
jgi:endonuclease/exonuclease/phosphatase family metal-dependent hydrolase